MAELKLTKEQIKKIIDDGKVVEAHYSATEWKYPSTGDDERSCPMLSVMFHAERKPGYIILVQNVMAKGPSKKAPEPEKPKEIKKEVKKVVKKKVVKKKGKK